MTERLPNAEYVATAHRLLKELKGRLRFRPIFAAAIDSPEEIVEVSIDDPPVHMVYLRKPGRENLVLTLNPMAHEPHKPSKTIIVAAYDLPRVDDFHGSIICYESYEDKHYGTRAAVTKIEEVLVTHPALLPKTE